MTQAHELDYLDHLARESARFASALRSAPSDARVPTCPDWNADDLLWHLGEVQWFWGTIVRDGVDADAADQVKPPRPANRPGLEEFYWSASRELSTALANTPPQTPAWTWADDKTVGFIRRRQAHEALIHRLDAELTAGTRSAMDPRLSADGVDEVLRIMYGGDLPDWGAFDSDEGNTLRIHATDTDDSWFCTVGHFSGTDPMSQRSYNRQPGIHVAEKDEGAASASTLAGTAADLDCWLWARPTLAPVDRSGNSAVISAFDAIIAAGIN